MIEGKLNLSDKIKEQINENPYFVPSITILTFSILYSIVINL